MSLTEPQSQDKKFFGLRRRRASSSTREKPATTVKKLKDLKLAFSEYYLSLVLLQSYQNLNFTGKYLSLTGKSFCVWLREISAWPCKAVALRNR